MYYIYKIENNINHKKYIGLTNNLKRRKYRHFYDLQMGQHDNSFLQKEYDMNKTAFSFEKIYEGDVDYKKISELEQYYIALYDSYYNGYNQNKGGNFGPSNGGSHLVEQDIFAILAACEFEKRPGQKLSDIFNVSKTTIMRIKKGINHCDFYEKYHKKTLEEREEIYHIFCENTDFNLQVAQCNSLNTRRKLSKEQAFMIFANSEFKIFPMTHLAKKFNVAPFTVTSIANRSSYRDWGIEYDRLSFADKQKIVTLFSNE